MPEPVYSSVLDGKTRWSRSSSIYRILFLLLLPFSFYLGISHYKPQLMSLEATKYNHCSAEEWSQGSWEKKTPAMLEAEKNIKYADILGKETEIYSISGFEGCASHLSTNQHLGSDDNAVTDKRRNVSGYYWVPKKSCRIGAFNKELFIQDLVERGGWYIVGDSIAESQMFSLSCLLYPHVIHVVAEGHSQDMSRAQDLMLDPNSPLATSIQFPLHFNLATNPLISFRRADLLHSRPELLKIQASIYDSRQYPVVFGADKRWTFDRSRDYYFNEFTAPYRYKAMIVETGGEWSKDVFSFAKVDDIVKFFEVAMADWVKRISLVLNKRENLSKQLIIKPFKIGHNQCESATAPWPSTKVVNEKWNWVKQFNDVFYNITTKQPHPRIHWLDIVRPSQLRPDSHHGNCANIIVGSGIFEGETRYIHHWLSSGYSISDYVPEQGKKFGKKLKEYISHFKRRSPMRSLEKEVHVREFDLE